MYLKFNILPRGYSLLSDRGVNRFTLTPKQWIQKINAKGFIAKPER
jgi:hypothetical protein